MKKSGRPTRLTPEAQKKIVEYVREGSYISTACVAAGVARSTFYNWEARAIKGQEPFKSFFDDLGQVEAQAEIDNMKKMLKGGKYFLPRATFLERRFRDRWGRSDRIAVEGMGPWPVSLQVNLHGSRPINVQPMRDAPKLPGAAPEALPLGEAPADGNQTE